MHRPQLQQLQRSASAGVMCARLPPEGDQRCSRRRRRATGRKPPSPVNLSCPICVAQCKVQLTLRQLNLTVLCPAGNGASPVDRGYQLPPPEIVEIIDAPPEPLLSFSPDRTKACVNAGAPSWSCSCRRARVPSQQWALERCPNGAGGRCSW